jgi:CCR4-NOT transcription complex subunit 1
MAPLLRDGPINQTVDALTKGLLRTLLVLLHDFPDYLSENHFSLCNLIPTGCFQLKNLVLSAFPRTKRLPDPFMPRLRMENIPENKDPPQLSVNLAGILDSLKIRPVLDKYLQIRAPEDLPKKLIERVKITPTENGVRHGVGQTKEKISHYNIDLLNAIVLYVGMHAIEASEENEDTGVLIFDANSPHMAFFNALNAAFDIEGDRSSVYTYVGRYHFLSAIANQLRYPNSHTYYFSCVILELFLQDDPPPIVYEQITRVLLERIVCNRPHPVPNVVTITNFKWGLLITFTSLLKQEQYRFWSMSFVKKAPEVR